MQSVQERMNTCTENSCNLYSGYHNTHLFLHLPFSDGDCNDEQRMWGEKVTNMNPDHILSLPDLNAVPCTTPHVKYPLTNCIKLFLVNYIFLLHQGSHSASRDFVIHTNLGIEPILLWKLCIFKFGDMHWLNIVTFSHTAITFVM